MNSRSDGTVIVCVDSAPSIPSPWTMTELDSANSIFILRGAWIFDRQLDVSRLRDGLGSVLSFYPHLAGWMVRTRAVDLCNRGVPFTVSSREAISVGDVLATPSLGHRFAGRLHPWLLGRGYEPALEVQLTRLRDGTLLNVSCSHACLDGRGVLLGSRPQRTARATEVVRRRSRIYHSASRVATRARARAQQTPGEATT